ncbi:catalase-related domain-containing protein [Sorangium sp. So ce341]|uniref:catalase-related domain-containing protein n=1 Tax=Sorangium sp. So ce341 TaxID=3133302 RepID=UPI003F5D8FAE
MRPRSHIAPQDGGFAGPGGWREEERRHEGYGSRAHPHPDHEPWKRDELVKNLIDALSQCDRAIQERRIRHLVQCGQDYGRRVAEGPSSRTDGSGKASG